MRRKFSRAFKMGALTRLEAGESVGEVARFYKIDPNVLRRWRRDYGRAREFAFPGPGRRPGERRMAQLRRQIELHVQEIDHLKLRMQSTQAQRVPLAKRDGSDLSV